SFDTWIMKVCYRKIVARSIGLRPSMYGSFTNGMDMVIHYESLQDDFRKILTSANIKSDAHVPVVNRTEQRGKGDYRSYYGGLSKRLVEHAYHHDLANYGYTF